MNKNTLWPRIREVFNQAHLWLGIASGIILFIVCLSGTIYTFSSDIQKALQPEKYWVRPLPEAQALSIEEFISRAHEQVGDTLKVAGVKIYADPRSAVELNLKKANIGASGKEKLSVEKRPKHEAASASTRGKQGDREKNVGSGGQRDRGTTYLMNPYSGELLGTTDGPVADFFMTMFKLHRWLLLDTEMGRPIVGWATVVFVIIILSGWVIWIPRKAKAWKQGLKVKWSANWKRVNHDLHNTLGFYASLLLLVMALTGLTWSFEWYKECFYKFFGQDPAGMRGKHVHSVIPEDNIKNLKPIDYKYLIQQTNELLPHEGDLRVSVPQEQDDAIRISKNKTGFFAPAAADVLSFDQYSGALTSAEIWAEKSLGEKIIRSIKPLHTGEIYSTFSKIIYFIACLIATTLPLTGTLIWINKLRKKKT